MTRGAIFQSGFGLAGLLLAIDASPMLITANRTLLHEKYSTTIALALLLDFTAFALLCSLVVYLISRIPESVVRRLAFVALIYVGLRNARHIFLLWVGVIAWVRSPRTLVISRTLVQVVAVGLVILAVASSRHFYKTVGKFAFLLPGLALFALVMWFQLARSVVAAERAVRTPVLAAAYPQGKVARRVVWILFDELSYREAFEKAEANGISLPAFESFRSKSVSFRNVVPAAYMTEFAVPSLFLGTAVQDVGAEGPRALAVKYAGQREYTAFDPQATIFGELRREHRNSAVVGWYYPYCDLLAAVISSCDWATDNMAPVVPGMFAEESVVNNAIGLAAENVAKLRGRRWSSKKGWEAVERHESYRHILQAAATTIEKPGSSLIFIHMPVPHPPGFYDRKTGEMSATGSYLGNVVLADHALKALMDAVQQSEEGGVTAVIVTSDHSWRAEIWRKEPGWSQEDAETAPSSYDARIPMLVHFPNQATMVEVDTTFAALHTRWLISDILTGKVGTPEAVKDWASARNTSSSQVAR